jgi:mono/diheme cytochrome c family protein
VAALLAVCQALATAQSLPTTPPPAGTAWDGVYTAAQADRAVEPFNQHCAGCHSLSDSGRSPLSGPEFWASYAHTGVDELLTYVATSMPNGRGGSLPAATYNDIVALMLKVNGFPAGTVELSPSTIAGVRIVPRDGSAVLPANALARVVGCLARQGGEWVLTHATTPVRITRSGAGEDDSARPLGDRTMPLKFVISRLDADLGARVSASGMLLGPGGAEGLNVTLVERVADRCP